MGAATPRKSRDVHGVKSDVVQLELAIARYSASVACGSV